MSSALFDSITRIARHESQARSIASVAIVTDVHSSAGADNDYALSIKLRDSGLVLKKVPIAAGVLGCVAMPEPGDLVVVVFMDGDVHAPVAVGRLHHPGKNPPAHDPQELVMSFPDGSEEPATHLSVARGDEARIRLTLGENFTLAMQPETARLAIGDMTLEITSQSGGRAELAAGGSTLVMKQDGDISITSKGKLLLEGQEVEVKGQTRVVVQGSEVNLN